MEEGFQNEYPLNTILQECEYPLEHLSKKLSTKNNYYEYLKNAGLSF
jgi:hypothetical protein